MAQKNREIEVSPQQMGSVIIFALAALLIAYIAFTGMYSVKASEQAVVLRFGKYLRTVGPGLHFKAPWIDQRIVVDQSERSLRLPHAEFKRLAVHPIGLKLFR